MDDYRVMVGFLDHPKTRRLKRRIGQHAVETVLRLWEFATSNSSRRTGDLTGMDNEAIADACRWEDDPDKLVDALRDSGYLDGEQLAYRVHDWRETNPYVATWQERSENAKAAANARWGKRDAPRMRPQRNGNAPIPDPSPDPIPDPTPDPDHGSGNGSFPITSIAELNARFAERCGIGIGPIVQGRLMDLLPVTPEEVDAIDRSYVRKWTGLERFLLGRRNPAPEKKFETAEERRHRKNQEYMDSLSGPKEPTDG